MAVVSEKPKKTPTGLPKSKIVIQTGFILSEAKVSAQTGGKMHTKIWKNPVKNLKIAAYH